MNGGAFVAWLQKAQPASLKAVWQAPPAALEAWRRDFRERVLVSLLYSLESPNNYELSD
jgi:hypothetical protein